MTRTTATCRAILVSVPLLLFVVMFGNNIEASIGTIHHRFQRQPAIEIQHRSSLKATLRKWKTNRRTKKYQQHLHMRTKIMPSNVRKLLSRPQFHSRRQFVNDNESSSKSKTNRSTGIRRKSVIFNKRLRRSGNSMSSKIIQVASQRQYRRNHITTASDDEYEGYDYNESYDNNNNEMVDSNTVATTTSVMKQDVLRILAYIAKPRNVLNILVTSSRIVMIYSLARAVWKIATTVSTSSLDGAFGSGDDSSLFVSSRAALEEALVFLEQPCDVLMQQIHSMNSARKSNKEKYDAKLPKNLQLITLAQQLQCSGLPLRSSTNTTTATTSPTTSQFLTRTRRWKLKMMKKSRSSKSKNASSPSTRIGKDKYTTIFADDSDGIMEGNSNDDDSSSSSSSKTSVESVLSSITRGEAKLMQEILWKPFSVAFPPDTSSTSVISQFAPCHKLWNAIVGLEHVKEQLDMIMVAVLSGTTNVAAKQFASLLGNDSSSATRGCMLYGPPGCGKTAIIKALASHHNVPCLVVTPSILLRPYFGQTSQQTKLLFSLAHKLAPCIMCIDELDALFRERSSTEHEVYRDLKTEFLQNLDGMLSSSKMTSVDGSPSSSSSIFVVGATNRPFDVDSAVIRRLGQSHYIGLPDLATRTGIIVQLLASVQTDSDVMDSNHILSVSQQTERFSPSDIKQLLQTAVLAGPMNPKNKASSSLSIRDIQYAISMSTPTQLSPAYQHHLVQFARQGGGGDRGRHNGPISMDENGVKKWETSNGNFYNVGTLEMDDATFSTLNDMLSKQQDDDSDMD